VGEASCAAVDFGRPKSSMSHHFRVLRDAGLVRTRNEGVAHVNALRREDLDRRFPGLLDAVIAAMRR
jgi:DNA-binding transcriptional ArsR family regulator